MVHKFLRIAGVKTKGEFYKKYPSEAAFFKAHPEARKMAEGGMMQDPSQGGGQDEQKQIVMQIAQALQQGAQPEQVMQQLVQMGMPQEQAMQIVQAVIQQMQGGAQQPPMRYGGGLPRAAFGMTLPNVENYPSYDTYKAAYNQYLSDIDTTTTSDPNIIDYSRYANDSIYNNPTIDTFAERINNSLIGKGDTTGNITPDASNNGIKTLKPDAQTQADIDAELNKDKNTGMSPWWLLAAAAAGYPTYRALVGTGKGIYKIGQKRLGETPEVDQSKLTPEQKAMNERRISNYKLTIDNRGYTVGKRDVNELVSRGMSRADAQAYVDGLPDKSGKSKKPATTQDDDNATTTSSNTTNTDDGGYTEPEYDFSDVNDVEDLVNYEYHRQKLQEDLDKGYDGSYHTKQLNKDPRTYLEDDIVWSSQKLQENLGTSQEAYYRDRIAETKAKLKRLNEIAPDAVAPGVGSVRGSATVTSSTSTGSTSQPTVNESGTEGSSAGSSTTGTSTSEKKETKKTGPTEKPTAEQTSKTKQRIKLEQDVRKGKKTTAELIAEAKAAGLDIQSGPTYRGVRANPDTKEDIKTYGRKRAQIKEDRKQLIEERIKEGKIKLAMGGYVPEYAAQAYGAYNLPQFEMGSYYAQGGDYPWNGTWNGNQGFAYGGANPFEDNPLRRFVYADGGMSPEQAAMMQQQGAPEEQGSGDDAQMQQIVEAVVNMLEQGMQPQDVMQKLVEAGLPQEMAQQVVQHIIEQQQGAQGQEPPAQEAAESEMPMRMYGGGDSFAYGGNSLHKFIGGGQPYSQVQIGQEMDVTPEQLEQLRRQGIQFKIIK